MTNHLFKSSFIFIIPFLFLISSLRAQDTSQNKSQRSFSSFGFQASWVAGTGITYCYTSNDFRYRVTGGWIKLEKESEYTYGFGVHYYLANAPGFNIFLGPSFGVYGSSKEDTKNRLALATCIETPFMTKEKRNNLCGGFILYYPTYYFTSGTLNPSAGLYVLYNF